MFKGAFTALVTPFRDGKVDYDRLAANVEFQISEGIDGLVPVGTTGESPTLSHDEHDKVIEAVVEAAAGRVPIIAGTGSNATDEAIRLTVHAKEVGANASLQVNPYYNKPTQEGMYRHFAEIATAVELPLVLYNAPGRCGVEIGAATIARLHRDFGHITAVKHATGSADGASVLMTQSDITVLSGDDSMTLPLLALGAKGVISVIANILPREMGELVRAGLKGEMERARELHLRLFPLAQALLSLETNPIPIKTAMSMLGLCSDEMRLPLCAMGEANRDRLRDLVQPWVGAIRGASSSAMSSRA